MVKSTKIPHSSVATRAFTLMEIIIAMAILALSLTGIIRLFISAQSRTANAWDKWNAVHMTTQAAEYLLMLRDEDAELPQNFFPYEGYSIQKSFDDAADLPEEYAEYNQYLPLRCLKIELVRDSDQKVLETVHVDRINYDYMTEKETDETSR